MRAAVVETAVTSRWPRAIPVEVRSQVPAPEPPASDAPRNDGEWRDIRCYHCRKLLARAKNPGRTVRSGELLQIKCACNRMNYVAGGPDE